MSLVVKVLFNLTRVTSLPFSFHWYVFLSQFFMQISLPLEVVRISSKASETAGCYNSLLVCIMISPVRTSVQPTVWEVRGQQNEDTLWRQQDVIVFPKCWLVLPRAQHLCPTNFVSCFWESSEIYLVSAPRATMLPRFATDGQSSQDTMLPPQCVLVLPGPK